MRLLLLLFAVPYSFGWLLSTKPVKSRLKYQNSEDDEYPWYFAGRAVMRPALVRLDPNRTPSNVKVLSALGWTLGGTVVLEYDESPVGPYREYVCLGGLGFNGPLVGQYGSRLFVNRKEAEKLCQDVWNLYAERSEIDLNADGDDLSLLVGDVEENEALSVRGWGKVGLAEQVSSRNFNSLPLLWTPAIKAIWTRVLFEPRFGDKPPLHRLRLSGTAKLSFNGFDGSSPTGVPLGFDIVLQNMLIEISPEICPPK